MTSPGTVAYLHRVAMATRLKNILGLNWGWYSNEEPKLHIQALDGKTTEEQDLKVWLEERGVRCFEMASGSLNNKEMRTLRAACAKKRDFLEQCWTVDIMGKGWIKATLKGHVVTVVCYPNHQFKFTRTIDLTKEFPGNYEHHDSWAGQKIYLTQLPRYGVLAVGPQVDPEERSYLKLTEWLWVDH